MSTTVSSQLISCSSSFTLTDYAISHSCTDVLKLHTFLPFVKLLHIKLLLQQKSFRGSYVSITTHKLLQINVYI
jgi:hypothetical protein